MTSDQKIGLLLGLVFIFVIAFLINGLPSLKASAHGNQLTYNMVDYQPEMPGLGTRERSVGYSMDAQSRSAEQPGRVALTDSPQVPALDDAQADVRFRGPLPTHGPEVSRNVQEVLRESLAAKAEQRSKPRPAKTQVYVVQSGDNLAKIAKKFYGATVGNKLATINSLFAANKAVLSSVDNVPAGAKLVIPLMTGTANQARKTDKAAAKTGAKTRRGADAHVSYTVKDGDSLWEIAAEQLGNGGRWKEIQKLNQSVLQDSIKVKSGMRLKLPRK